MTSDIIALATLGGILLTAIGTLALAVSTRRLAGSTEQQARSTSDSVDLQRRELQAVEEQLRLAREEFNAARDADRAKLQIDAGFALPTQIMGSVKYMSGREPAYDIEVWGRSWAGYSGGKIAGIMSPQGRYGVVVTAEENPCGPLSDEDRARWPFPETEWQHLLAENESWVGVTWRTHDGYRGRQLYHQPPGKPREYHGPVLEPGPAT